jgi:FkbM family methyltransferase
MFRHLKSIRSGFSRRMNQRVRFEGFGDWTASMYDAVLRFLPGVPMPSRGTVRAVRVRGVSRPVHVRMGSSDGFVLEEVFIRGVYRDVVEGAIEPVRLIIDLGANVGMSVRLFGERFKDARIIALEPDPDNFRICKLNIGDDLNARVTLIEAAAADRTGWVHLDRSAEQCSIRMDGAIGADATPGAVRTTSMDDILSAHAPTGPIDLLKCDIEGGEAQVFRDCRSWLSRVRYLMIELHPPYGRSELMKDLERNGGQFEVLSSSETAGNELLWLRNRSLTGAPAPHPRP